MGARIPVPEPFEYSLWVHKVPAATCRPTTATGRIEIRRRLDQAETIRAALSSLASGSEWIPHRQRRKDDRLTLSYEGWMVVEYLVKSASSWCLVPLLEHHVRLSQALVCISLTASGRPSNEVLSCRYQKPARPRREPWAPHKQAYVQRRAEEPSGVRKTIAEYFLNAYFTHIAVTPAVINSFFSAIHQTPSRSLKHLARKESTTQLTTPRSDVFAKPLITTRS